METYPIASMYGIFTYMYHKNQPYMDGMGMTRSRILMDDNRSICAASTQALILMQILEAKGGGAFFSWGSHGFFFPGMVGFRFSECGVSGGSR